MSSCCPLPGYDHKGLSYCNCTSVSRRRNPAVLSDLYGSDAMTYAAVAQGLRERKERPPHAIPSSLTILQAFESSQHLQRLCWASSRNQFVYVEREENSAGSCFAAEARPHYY